MNIKKKLVSLSLCASLFLTNTYVSFADSARVVTLGANLSTSQRETMLNYFGVNENEVVIVEVNNQEERKYLEGVATEAQLGNKTFSCSFVEPTKSGSGINVKIANLTWLTSSMVASTLSTAGLTDADVVAASVFPVSGTGALTGIMKAFEDASGEPLEEDKKELASEELVVTGGLGEDENIGPDKATGIVNDIKTEIIKNNTKDTIQIAETIVNVTNNYNVNLTDEQQKQLEDLMKKVAEQDYNYKEMKDTLEGIQDDINDKLDEIGESINTGFLDSIKNFFGGIGEWFENIFASNDDLGILGSTNDDVLGEDAIIDATDKDAINTNDSNESQDENIFTNIWNWFLGLFNDNSDDSDLDNTTEDSNDSTSDEKVDDSLTDDEDSSLDSNSDSENNIVPEIEDGSNDVLNDTENLDNTNEDNSDNNESLDTSDSNENVNSDNESNLDETLDSDSSNLN